MELEKRCGAVAVLPASKMASGAPGSAVPQLSRGRSRRVCPQPRRGRWASPDTRVPHTGQERLSALWIRVLGHILTAPEVTFCATGHRHPRTAKTARSCVIVTGAGAQGWRARRALAFSSRRDIYFIPRLLERLAATCGTQRPDITLSFQPHR